MHTLRSHPVQDGALLSHPLPDGTKAPAAGASLLPHKRRVLLKHLLRAVSLVVNYTPSALGEALVRPLEGDGQYIPACLKAIFANPKQFGGNVFGIASNIMSEILNQDPLCFPELDQQGLPVTYIQTLRNGVLPVYSALCSIPGTLMAICLNSGGKDFVKESQVLECLIPIFTSETYLKALQNDTPAVIGGGLD